MKLFRCTCSAAPVLYFENVSCGSCGRLVGFCPETCVLKPFVRAGEGVAGDLARVGAQGGEQGDGQVGGQVGGRGSDQGGARGDSQDIDGIWLDDDGHRHRLCDNRTRHAACNWMIRCADTAGAPEAPAAALCVACRRNRVIPDLSVPGNLELWQALERAKRRCLFSFLALELPFDGAHPAMPALGFRFMADGATSPPGGSPGILSTAADGRVLTGHEDGIVTINLAEADEIARTRMRVAMRERYRTLLGHFRHETGHYIWDWFARTDAGFIDAFRQRFGDERADYAAALAAHYASGSPPNWSDTHISAYATMHPWEDWAETWAHYLHIIDTLETQQSFGVETRLVTAGISDIRLPFAVGTGADGGRHDFDDIVALWIEASVMLNSLNRSMGLPDPYPFVLSATVIEKLRFVHTAVLAAPGRG